MYTKPHVKGITINCILQIKNWGFRKLSNLLRVTQCCYKWGWTQTWFAKKSEFLITMLFSTWYHPHPTVNGLSSPLGWGSLFSLSWTLDGQRLNGTHPPSWRYRGNGKESELGWSCLAYWPLTQRPEHESFSAWAGGHWTHDGLAHQQWVAKVSSDHVLIRLAMPPFQSGMGG